MIKKINIEIDNLTEAQALALEDMLCHWKFLGNIGCSRWTAFYADGDGDFRPKIKIDGRDPKRCEIIDQYQTVVKIEINQPELDKTKPIPLHFDYAIDFDWIGWALHKEKK